MLSTLIMAGCADAPSTDGDADAFMTRLMESCGQTLRGAVVEDDTQDATWGGAELVVGPVKCAPRRVEMPLALAGPDGTDASRTWIVTQDGDALTLKHRHLLKDGSVDPVSNYGGTADPARGSAVRQVFPADAESVATFNANDLEASTTNRWVMEHMSGGGLAYELRRPASATAGPRVFRVEVMAE